MGATLTNHSYIQEFPYQRIKCGKLDTIQFTIAFALVHIRHRNLQ